MPLNVDSRKPLEPQLHRLLIAKKRERERKTESD